jgi:5-methylcytosine-specific restriction endonuclease McrA
MKYTDKLKDQRWNQKRLEILRRDEYTCQYCGLKETELHVHHIVYQSGKEPWESLSADLLTLCEACHEAEHDIRTKAEDALLSILRNYKFSAVDILQIGNIITSRIVHKPCAGSEFVRALEQV